MTFFYRSLIIDDEENARRALRRLLASYDKKIKVIEEARDGEEALCKINELSPDLVFLDIHLPKMDGFQVIENLKIPIPKVIFTTAYDKYAIKAFDVNSIDYLLKPIRADRLDRAIARLPDMNVPAINDLSSLHYALKEMERIRMKRIQVKVGEVISFLNLSEVCYFQGEDYLTGIHTVDRKYLIEMPLYELETRLPASEFVRIHRSTIVNVVFIKEIRRSFGGKLQVILKQPIGKELTISRTYAKQIDELFQCI